MRLFTFTHGDGTLIVCMTTKPMGAALPLAQSKVFDDIFIMSGPKPNARIAGCRRGQVQNSLSAQAQSHTLVGEQEVGLARAGLCLSVFLACTKEC